MHVERRSPQKEPDSANGPEPIIRECGCGVQEGHLHDWGCEWEHCPFCESWFVAGCDCPYLYLGLKSRNNRPDCDQLPEATYKKGLTEDEEERWFNLCAQRGRIPFVYSPQLCARCGQQWPDLFAVQDQVWGYYLPPNLRDQIVCLACFRLIKRQIDKFNPRPEWLPNDYEIEAYIKAWKDGDKAKLKKLAPDKFKSG